MLRARILLPTRAERWPAERLRAILVHELGHVRRRDPLVQLVAQVATAVYWWWNPLVWVAASRPRVEREHACDDLVLAAGFRASSYAEDLLVVARAVASGPPAPADAIGAVDPSWTGGRIRRILDPGAPRRRPSRPVRLAGASAVLVLAATVPRSSALAEPVRPEVPLPVCGGASVATPSAVAFGEVLWPQGTLDPAEITAEVAARLGDVDACFRTGAFDGASVVVRWSVDLAGRRRLLSFDTPRHTSRAGRDRKGATVRAEVLVSGRTRSPARPRNPDPPALLDEGPQLHLDQELLGNQAVIDLTLGGGRAPKPGLLDFDNPNPQLDRRPVSIGPVDDEAPTPQMDWRVAPRTEPSSPTPTAPEAPRGVDTIAPKILPAGRGKKF